MSAERTHFVYRVYDEFDTLLYVGCSHHPHVRWSQHQSDGRLWAPFAKRFKVAGPYLKADAFDREREAIKNENPTHNAQTRHRRAQRLNYTEQERLRQALNIARPELRESVRAGAWESPEFAEMLRLHEEITEQAAKTHPTLDERWRHGQYLEGRARLVAVA